MMTEPDICFSTHPAQQGQVGLMTLNRPATLNALTHSMVKDMHRMLQEWAGNSHIHAIVLQAVGEKAFCAGGDIRQLYHAALSQDEQVFDFFSDEYRLDYYLATEKKPVVSLLNGITMGGGVGISQLGGIRIATEKYIFAMPEVGIGFFPDVGGSYFLPRLPHHAGFYLALTGAKIHADTALELGLVDYVVASQDMDALRSRLLAFPWHDPKASLQDAIFPYLRTPAPSPLRAEFPTINACFQATSIEEILDRLHLTATPFALETIDTLLKQSPTSLKVTLQQCLNGKKMDIGECLQMEYRMVQQFFKHPDFIEGIRAAIIDKDRHPHWQPAKISTVTEADVASYFAPRNKVLELS